TEALARGPVYAALAALAGGFIVSLTPCVYPMVAVTVSVFGARQAKSRWEGAALSAAFVLGIVAMFVPLGVVAGLTGSIFGSVLQNRWVVVAMALLFLTLAASLFGAFELALPEGLTNRLAMIGGIGYRGAFLLGLACGLIASPCTGPVLTGILAWIAKTKSAGLGALAMGAFALGLGVPFFVVGTFAVQLPKSGRWMVHVKSVLGIVLVVVAFYFLSGVFPVLGAFARPGTLLFGVATAAIVLGLGLGAVHREFSDPVVGVKVAKGLGLVLTSGGLFALVLGLVKPAEALAWQQGNLDSARAQALRESKPMIVDFTAAWCGACKELDKATFSARPVGVELGRFVAVRVDATNDEDPKVGAALQRFGVRGLPTVVIFDSRGREALRYTDFVPPERFLESIRAVD
ncbi:MAG TPA: cytochrome c biogenesis protein CcdA, partial [Polyangiaceae bacterium]|nr:cytochrome c biogenesis protein CcdA [Polyangiaceae bacterium]